MRIEPRAYFGRLFVNTGGPEDGIYWPAVGPFRRIFYRRIPTDAFARSIIYPKDSTTGVGMPCSCCLARGAVRVLPRIYWCQLCEAWSLVSIGKKLSGEGLKTLRYQPTEDDEHALKARLAQS